MLGWHIEKFMAVLLNVYQKTMESPEHTEMCYEISQRFVAFAATSLHYRVADLVPDVSLENFKQDLRGFGRMKKKFVNDVWGILSDVPCFISSDGSFSPRGARS